MERHWKISATLIASSPAFIMPFPVNALPHELAASVPNSIGRNSPF